jgi:hypothetical protein
MALWNCTADKAPENGQKHMGKQFEVFVDDNYHHMGDSEAYRAGSYSSLDEAIEKCRNLTISSLEDFWEPGISPEKLSAQWCLFGDDPFIRGPVTKVPFSARKFITTELCRKIIEKREQQEQE